MNRMTVLVATVLVALTGAHASAQAESFADSTPRFALAPHDRILVVGGTLDERLAFSGYFDALAHAAFPDHHLVIRHAPGSADEVSVRPREMNVPAPEDWLDQLDATVIVAAFGMSESFAGPDGLVAFRNGVTDLMGAYEERVGHPLRFILLSPIAHEDLGAPMVTGTDLAARRANLAAYTNALRDVAASTGAGFVDLYAATLADEDASAVPITSNGIHPNELGCYYVARAIGEQLGWMAPTEGADTGGGDPEALRTLAYDKHYHFRLRYRATNTEYVWGRRHTPFGLVNFPPELTQLERMVAAREAGMWSMRKPTPRELFRTPPSGPAVWETVPTSHDFPEDDWNPEPVEAKGSETSLGNLDIKPPDEFKPAFTVADGYVIECFASEQDFEELESPLAMSFDARGRLWVIVAPTYPHLMPGEMPRCKLVVLEDTDDDGRADDLTIFAEHLYIPTGFAIDTDAVYLGQAPDLWKLTDTDGDGRADRREIVASGFGMPDSHHTISAFEWDTGGGIVMHEGVFTRTNLETPYGTRRTLDAAVWRFDPRTQHLETLSHCGFANPWGHVFDDYGNSVLADASGGDNFAFAHVMTAFDYPNKPKRRGPILNRGRPTAGCELISSRHFPEDVQHTFLVNQSIGFHGTRWDRLIDDGSSWRAERMPQDLLESSDVNFRPVAMEVGPDGALYIVDWCNPIVGHMQYSVRDPRRDHTHGRVWRVRHATRPLLEPPTIIGASIPELLELLRIPERNTRQHARRRLQRAAPSEVFPELKRWVATLDPADPRHDRLVLESLWIHQGQGRIDLDLLDRVSGLTEPKARAAAYRVLRHWLQAGAVSDAEALPRLARGVADGDMRVRIEAVLACGFTHSVEGAAVAAVAAERDMDEGLRVVLEETVAYLAKYGEPDSTIVRRLRLERMDADALIAEPMDAVVADVMIARPDVPEAVRRAALAHQVAEGRSAVDALLGALAAARHPGASIPAVTPLLLGLGPDVLGGAEPELRAATDASATRATAWAALVFAGRDTMDEEPVPLIAMVLELLPAHSAPAALVARVQTALERHADGTTYAGDLMAALDAIAHQTADDTALAAWLTARVDAVEDIGLEAFDAAHAVAMGALRALNHLPTSAWPEDAAHYVIAPADSERLARGAALYHDEIVGCVRCHGPEAHGEEGFPPLSRSPWILGRADRAARIVIHGLQGRVTVKGEAFESIMEPLGPTLADDQIADVLTYVRQNFGNYAPPVERAAVREARSDAPGRGMPWDATALARKYPLYMDHLVPSPTASMASTVRPEGGIGFGTIGVALAMPLGAAVFALVVVALVGRMSVR